MPVICAVVFGIEEVDRIHDRENVTEASACKVYTFDTEAEKKAFEKGLSEGVG